MMQNAVAPANRAFRHRGFVFYWIARSLGSFAVQIVSVSLGWKVYDITRDPLSLGIVGLVQFLPSLALVLFTGAVADRYSRRLIMALCLAAELLAVLGLVAFALTQSREVAWIYALLTLMGIARAFFSPAMQALVPNLVPQTALADAVAWNTTSWQLATILGPVAGGLLYGLSEFAAFATALAFFVIAIFCVTLIPRQPPAEKRHEESAWDSVSAGFRYVFSNPIVLGAISLDLFAVLLGGAVALMPIFARDILDVGPWGLGLMRAAPGIGALVVAGALAFYPIHSRAGHWMFGGVAVFGLATLGFGLSTTPWFSIFCLAMLGAGDMISVYVREVLIQLATPDAVRGRVNAVNMVFVGASNELGEFRAGVMASMIGAVGAVVVGGAGTLLIAGLWAQMFPALRKAERLDRLD